MARRGADPANLAIAVGPSNQDDPTQELTSFASVTVRMNFVDGDQVDFAVLGGSPEADEIDELATDVWIYGPIEQRFRITTVDQTWNEDGADELSVKALSYKHLLSSRHIAPGGLTLTNTDQGEVVWAMIAQTQARPGGNWRVTKGAVLTGQLRDRTYVEGENMGTLATNLQEVINGLWWDIDADLVLNASLVDAFTLQPTPVELGMNARRLIRKSAASLFADAVFVDGDKSKTTAVWRQTAAITTDPRGRWEMARGYPTVELQETLEEHADGLLLDVESPRASWQIDMEATRWLSDSRYLPGDFVIVEIPTSTVAPIGTPAREVICQVVEVAATFDADTAMSVSMSVVETDQVV